MRKTCEQCRFWDKAGGAGEDTGLCRRHAPRPEYVPPDKDGQQNTVWSAWPLTLADEWCGEFEEV